MPINSFEHLKQIEKRNQKRRETSKVIKDDGKNKSLRGFL
ncbi:hypothetical protein LCGC14_2097780 [marine sediment metagenome]|uniref:Uncharacterized protein n=1 Tax=marine sediment metagenome TaxID=412755 RepID=A0A0F9EB11_9ZZZZ